MANTPTYDSHPPLILDIFGFICRRDLPYLEIAGICGCCYLWYSIA